MCPNDRFLAQRCVRRGLGHRPADDACSGCHDLRRHSFARTPLSCSSLERHYRFVPGFVPVRRFPRQPSGSVLAVHAAQTTPAGGPTPRLATKVSARGRSALRISMRMRSPTGLRTYVESAVYGHLLRRSPRVLPAHAGSLPWIRRRRTTPSVLTAHAGVALVSLSTVWLLGGPPRARGGRSAPTHTSACCMMSSHARGGLPAMREAPALCPRRAGPEATAPSY
ncbi:hypothetical protein MBT84_38095 [Streptomyces sp. MBT84]|nr:hypothetical protein [Streptomyces sp. MBT84]